MATENNKPLEHRIHEYMSAQEYLDNPRYSEQQINVLEFTDGEIVLVHVGENMNGKKDFWHPESVVQRNSGLPDDEYYDLDDIPF